MIRALATREKAPCSNPHSGICSELDSTLNGGQGRFEPRLQNMTLVHATHQPLVILMLHFFFLLILFYESK